MSHDPQPPPDDDATRRVSASDVHGAQPPDPPPGYEPPYGQFPGHESPPPYGQQPPSGYDSPPYGYGQQPPPYAYGQPPPGQQPPPYGYGQPPPPYGYAAAQGPYVPGRYGPRPGSDDRSMAMLAHLLGLLVSWVGPLILYLVKKDESPYVRDQAAEALNFQITVFAALMISGILTIVVIGIILLPIVWIGALIFQIQAAVSANRGENFRYPFSIRLIS
jgi:uncharacterized Tic20 family protein